MILARGIQLGCMLVFVLGGGLRAVGGPSDMLFKNGTIWTGDSRTPWVEALWIQEGRVREIGDNSELLARIPEDTNVVDLQGAFVSPGLIDAHAHVLGFGLQLDRVDLVGAASLKEALARVASKVETVRASGEGGWILGRGWDQNDWPEKNFPTREELDRVCTDFPIALGRIDGHALWVNSRALEEAGIDGRTPEPPGGKIYRDSTGEATGVLVDNATQLLEGVIPEPGHSAKMNAIREALSELVKVGLTGVHDMGMDRDDLAAYRELSKTSSVSARVYASFSVTDPSLSEILEQGPDKEWNGSWFKLGMVKFYLDGALGSRGAALLEPYSDDPGNSGLAVMEEAEFEGKLSDVVEHGFQVAVHAIGDRGNRIALDTWSRVRPLSPSTPPVGVDSASLLGPVPAVQPQFRLEHAQIVSLVDIPRFRDLQVVASMQPTHCTSDMPWAPTRLGDARLRGAYAWRSFAKHGVLLPFGSDFPVESHDPRLGLYAAVTRRSLVTGEGWSPEERMGREEALVSFTAAPAYVSGDLDKLGTLSPGKYADLVVWDQNLITCDPDRLPQVKVLMTLIGGVIVWDQRAILYGGQEQ